MSTNSSVLEDFFSNPRRLIAILAVLLLAGGAAVGFSRYQERKLETQRESLFSALKTLETETKAIGDTNGYQRFNPTEKLPKTVEQLGAILKSGTKSLPVFESGMTLARLYFDHGEIAQAQEYYKKSEAVAPSFQERAAALKGQAATQEAQGQYAQALATYQTALQAGDSWVKAEILLGQARCQLQLGQKDAAKSTLERVAGEYPNSGYQRQAETLKGQL